MENLQEHKSYFGSGKIKSEWTTLGNVIHGEYKRYLSNGKIIKKIIYNRGTFEKLYDCSTDTEYTPNDFIEKFKKFSQIGLAEGMRAFSGSYFTEIIDIPTLDEKIDFEGQLLFKVWGKNSELWLVFLIGDHKLIKIPVYRNKDSISTYTGKHCSMDFSRKDNWLEVFKVETMKASSGRVYVNQSLHIEESVL